MASTTIAASYQEKDQFNACWRAGIYALSVNFPWSSGAGITSKQQSSKDALVGTILVAAPRHLVDLAKNLLIKQVGAFVAIHPQVVVDILASDQQHAELVLVDERVDITLKFTDKTDDALIARKLFANLWQAWKSRGTLAS